MVVTEKHNETINEVDEERFFKLEVSNVNEFINNCTNMLNYYYKNRFKILSELEDIVESNPDIKTVILIEYKSWGDCIFRLKGINLVQKELTYEYEGVIS